MELELREYIEEIGEKIVQEIMNQLIKLDKVASGKLLNSLTYKVVKTIEGYTIQIVGEDYLQYVNDGREPGILPPVSKIQTWVSQKGIKMGNKTDLQTAWIISKSIQKKGIEPTYIVDKAINKILSNMDIIINKGLDTSLQNQFNKI